jgi:hypothetical protein
MTRTRVLLVLLAGLLTGWLLLARGAFSCPTTPDSDVATAEPLRSAAAWRCLHAEPNHWRSCVLQH